MKSRLKGVGAAGLAGAVCLGMVAVVPQAHAAAPLAPVPVCTPGGGGVSNSVKVDGFVNTPTSYTLSSLQALALPMTTVDVTDVSPALGGANGQWYTGVALSDLLGFPASATTPNNGLGNSLEADNSTPQVAAGTKTAQKNDLTRFSVLVTGTDCFQALFSAAELDSFWGLGNSGAQKPILAWAQGTSGPGPVTGPLGGSGGPAGAFEVISPNDSKGSRSVHNVAEIRVLAPPASTDNPVPYTNCAGAEPASVQTALDGWVTTATSYTPTSLQALGLPTTTVNYPTISSSFTGVALSDLLGLPAATSTPNNGLGNVLKADVPGPQAPMLQKNDLTRFAVMVTGDDCFQALFSAAELDPTWGLGGTSAQKPILAWAQGATQNTAPFTAVTGSLGTSGPLRVVAPNDSKGSRSISNVVEIQVLEAPTPVISWHPHSTDTNQRLGARQLNATATLNGSPATDGTFTYTPGAGTRLPKGTQNLAVFYTPGDQDSVSEVAAVSSVLVRPVEGLPICTGYHRVADCVGPQS